MKHNLTPYRHLLILGILLVIPVILGGCSPQKSAMIQDTTPTPIPTEKAGTYKKITPEEGKKMLDSDKAIILVDVRTQEEFNEGHIGGSILIPNDVIAEESSRLLPDKEKTIIVYCRSGRRSQLAVNELLNLGYKNVLDLGGIKDWPYEITK